MEIATQTVATRNQSTANYERKRIFVFDNRFKEGVYKNVNNETPVLEPGMLVARDVNVVDGFIPVNSSNLADVIGISANETLAELTDGQTVNINICTKGTIEGVHLTLPVGVDYNTAVGNKSLKDVLEGIGFHLEENALENTKFDN